MMNVILAIWVVIGAVHLGVPLAYFGGMRRIAAKRDYHLSLTTSEQPSVSVIIPTYNESQVIESKISNIIQGDYPTNKLEVIVVDSASTDGTAELARQYLSRNRLRGLVIDEPKRTGKSGALNLGLARATSELVCISDAECRWRTDALRNAVKYFSDPTIGAVSGVHHIQARTGTIATDVEGSYRSVYRMLRVAESKLDSTPVGEGEIQLFRRREMTWFDPNVGGDDTCAALCMVQKGFRAISADDVVFFDPAPPAWRARFRQKIRRGQHVLQAFFKHKGLLRGNRKFSRVIFPMEFFLYAINPLIFPVFLVLTGLAMFAVPALAYLLAAGVIVVLIVPGLRTTAGTYLSNNLTMIGALVQEARGNKQLVWTKIEENREPTGIIETAITHQ